MVTCISVYPFQSIFFSPICAYKTIVAAQLSLQHCRGFFRSLQLYFSDSTRRSLLLGTDGCLPARSSGTKTIWRENFAQRRRHNHLASTCFRIFSISQVLTFAFLEFSWTPKSYESTKNMISKILLIARNTSSRTRYILHTGCFFTPHLRSLTEKSEMTWKQILLWVGWGEVGKGERVDLPYVSRIQNSFYVFGLKENCLPTILQIYTGGKQSLSETNFRNQ